MKNKLIAMVLSTASIATASAADLTISLTNLTHGSHFTPLLFSAHDAEQHIFEIGTAASTSLQAMAEGGDISGLASDLTALNADTTTNPANGLTAPGQTVNFDMTTMPSNTHLSVAAMILPTNDGFVGLDSLEIPTEAGTYTYYLNGYDAGTEINDEIINGAGAPGAPGVPADPLGQGGSNATGLSNSENNASVHIHRGVIGDTDPAGGASDLDSRVHRWLNPIARLVVEVK
ncbi:MAG: spondin domain-containing protein [Gammaproteobacteria bacterium]|nr:spondin domain-containing protein [Gammaproteobacteria bacterium]